MEEKVDVKPESILNFDDLLQCPVCYEIPSGQIFQCNEGHHVCGRCKMRLDVCPVCRAFFFGTRNYAMEELIANFKKMKSLQKSSKGSGSSESSTPAIELPSTEAEENVEEDINSNTSTQSRPEPPRACKGLFRCLCCKTGATQRLPAARLLNHLRYFHRPDLIEGRSENGEYLQAWQFNTTPGKIVTAVRIADMGIFFLTIEIVDSESLRAWLTMAATTIVSSEFSYTLTITGNDREAIFSDYTWSVRACEGTMKKHGNCLAVTGADARALLSGLTISGKLLVRRHPYDQRLIPSAPRVVLRIANRGQQQAQTRTQQAQTRTQPAQAEELAPLLEDIQNDALRFLASLNRETNNLYDRVQRITENANVEETVPLSRNARRRMRQRLRAALTEETAATNANVHTNRNAANAQSNVTNAQSNVTNTRSNVTNTRSSVTNAQSNVTNARPNVSNATNARPNVTSAQSINRNSAATTATRNPAQTNTVPSRGNRPDHSPVVHFSGIAIVEPTNPSSSGPSNGQPANRPNKKKRRHRR